MSIYLSIYLSRYEKIGKIPPAPNLGDLARLFILYIYMSRSVHPYIDLYGYFSIHLSIYSSIYLYIYLSIYVCIYPIYPSIFISQFIYLSIYLTRSTTRCWCVWGGCVTPLELKLNVSAANTIYPTWSRRNSKTAILNCCYLVIFIFTQEKYNLCSRKNEISDKHP